MSLAGRELVPSLVLLVGQILLVNHLFGGRHLLLELRIGVLEYVAISELRLVQLFVGR